ncbi:MAG: UDP-2,3-diacylglucosamine diphosphatase [Gammaproteobacteria bacterium]
MTSQTHKTYFLSDIHLEENQPTITQNFLNFLANCHTSVDGIYILGDLFESWIGDDDDTPFHQQIIQALRQTALKGIPIYFLHGNRDFLIGKKFARLTNCQLLAEEEKINLYGTPVLLMHGDTLCQEDLAYLKMRKWFHHPVIQFLFKLAPLSWRRKFADNMRNKSRQYTQTMPANKMDVTPAAVQAVMQKHGVNYLIHGHTHKPNFHSLEINGQPATRIVLAAWHDGGEVVAWPSAGEKEVIKL